MITTTHTDYPTNAFGYDIIVPAGSKVSSISAMGDSPNTHFWVDFAETARRLTGHKRSILHHNLTYYGIDVPAKYCNPYPNK